MIYDPTTFQQFTSNGIANVIPVNISPEAVALLNYFPEPNLTGSAQNLPSAYHCAIQLDTGRGPLHARPGIECDSVRGLRPGWWWRRRRRKKKCPADPGLRQSINFNYNWSHRHRTS